MKTARLLLAEDHPQILKLLRKLLEPDYHVVGAVMDGEALISAAIELRPDVIVSDIDMPVLNGLEAVRQLRSMLPECRVIFLSGHDEPDYVAAAFAAGATGYLIKGADLLSEVRSIIDRLEMSGEGYSLAPRSSERHAAGLSCRSSRAVG